MATITHPGAPIPPPFPITDALKVREYHLGSHYAATHGGLLPQDPFWKYFEYRHDFAPVRFDAYHPRFGRLIERDEFVRHHMTHPAPPPAVTVQPPAVVMQPPAVAPVVIVPGVPVVGIPGPVPMSPVPEPSSGLMLGVGLVAIAWLAGRAMRRGVRP